MGRNRGKGGKGRGGAKGAMRNRGKGGDSMAGGFDRSGKDRPCVGLCFLRKLRGEDPVPYEYKPSCAGLCYLNKLRGVQVPAAAPPARTPCVGLCFLAKLGQVKTEEEEEELEEEYEEEEDYEGSLDEDYEEEI